MQNHIFKQEEGSHTWGVRSSKKWCCVVALEFPNISNEHSAFILKGQGVHDRKYQTSNISSHPRRLESSIRPLWLTQISYSFTELLTNSIPMCEQISCASQTLCMFNTSQKNTQCSVQFQFSDQVLSCSFYRHSYNISLQIYGNSIYHTGIFIENKNS